MNEYRAPVIEDLSLLCPKCGQGNRCVVAQGGRIDDCWCTQVTMDAQVLHGIEDDQWCLCAACASCATSSESNSADSER